MSKEESMIFILKVWGAVILGLLVRSLLLRIIAYFGFYLKDRPLYERHLIEVLQAKDYSYEEAEKIVKEAMK